MSNKIIAVVVVLAVLAAAAAFLRPERTDDAASGAAGIEESLVTDAYTLAQVAQHASPTDCWTVIRGGVFDLTAWIAEHPGGSEAIIGLCGKDGTESFVSQHEGQPDPENALARFRIGDLE